MTLTKNAIGSHDTNLSVEDLSMYLDDCDNKELDMVSLSFQLNEDGSLKTINITGYKSE